MPLVVSGPDLSLQAIERTLCRMFNLLLLHTIKMLHRYCFRYKTVTILQHTLKYDKLTNII